MASKLAVVPITYDQWMITFASCYNEILIMIFQQEEKNVIQLVLVEAIKCCRIPS